MLRPRGEAEAEEAPARVKTASSLDRGQILCLVSE